MTLLPRRPGIRRKAVWGPKATLAALLAAAMALAPDVMAKEANRHANQGKKAKPGAPSSSVKYSRFDEEVVRRMKGKQDDKTTKIIVRLMPGAQLPPQFKRFVKGGILRCLGRFLFHLDIFRLITRGLTRLRRGSITS